MVPLVHIIYALLFALGALFVWTARNFPGPMSQGDIGPALFPTWLAIGMMTLIVVDLFISRRQTKCVALNDIGLAVLFGFSMAGTIWAADRFGFFYILPGALFIGLWIMGSRRLLANGLFSLALPALTWLIFDYFLTIPIAEL